MRGAKSFNYAIRSNSWVRGARNFNVSSREKGGSGAARSIPFLLLPFRSKPLKLPLPGLELIRSAPVGAVRGRGLLMKELLVLCVLQNTIKSEFISPGHKALCPVSIFSF